MKKLLPIAILLGLLSWQAEAQGLSQAIVVDSCPTSGSKPLSIGLPNNLFMDKYGNLCSSASLTGSITVGSVNQGTPAVIGNAWPTYLSLGGAAVALTNALPVAPISGTTGGASNYHVIAAASDNHAVIKNGAGTVYDMDCTTSGTAFAYVRLYDAGTGFNACNSATNLQWGMVCPAAASASGTGAGFAKSTPAGRTFTNGISICITGALGDTDTTNAPTTAVVNIGYK